MFKIDDICKFDAKLYFIYMKYQDRLNISVAPDRVISEIQYSDVLQWLTWFSESCMANENDK